MLRNLPLLVFFLLTSLLAKAQEPCEVVFDLFGVDTLCTNALPIYLPPVEPFGGTYSGEGVTANGLFDPTGLSAGQYDVFYTADSAICIGSGSAFITLIEPVPFTLVGSTELCEGESTVLSCAEGYELTWEDGTKSVSREFFPDSTYLTSVSYVNEFGCAYTQEFVITVLNFDRVEITAPQQWCYGQEITFEVLNASSVQWQIDLSEEPSITAAFTQDTILEIKIYVGSCDTIINYPIDVSDSIEYEFVTDTTLCTGQLAHVVAYGNALSYRFDGYGEFTDSLDFELADDATVYVQIMGEFDCVQTDVISYIVDEYPSLSVTYPDSLCQGFPIEIFASGAYEYVWLDMLSGDTLLAGAQQDFQLNAEQSLDWSIVGSSFYGCQLIQDVDVYVDPTPDVRIDTLTAFCLEKPILLQANGAFQYTWSNGFVGDTLAFEGSTDTVFSVIGATALGCMNYDTLSIAVHEVPIVTAFGENSICEGDTATVTAIGATTYIWGGSIEGSSVDLTPIADSAVTFVGYNVYGCADFSIFNINVDPAPFIGFVGPNYICEGDSASLEILTDGSFTWLGGSIDAVIPITPLDDTTYVVTSIGGNGCPRTVAFDVAVFPYPQLSFNGPGTLCYGDTAQVILAGADDYSWSNGLQGDSVLFVPQGSQTILIYGSSNEGCTSIYPYSIVVNPSPQVYFAFSADTLCESGSGISWTASPSGGTLSGDGVVNNWFDLGAALSGVNTVHYTVTNGFNCVASVSDELIVETCLSVDTGHSNGFQLYPNPATNNALLTGSGPANYTVMNSQGQVMLRGQFSSQLNLDLTEWSAGIYLIELLGANSTETVRLVKQ